MSIYKDHQTADGRRIPICMMDDDHLINQIHCILNRMAENHPGNYSMGNNRMDELSQFILASKTVSNLEQIRNNFTYSLEALEPYMLELMIRFNPEDPDPRTSAVIRYLQTILGRSSGVQNGRSIHSLMPVDEDLL